MTSGTDSATYNLVFLSSLQVVYQYDSFFSTKLQAAFQDSLTGNKKSVKLYLNGTLMSPTSDSLYNNILNDSTGTIYPGTAVSVKIQGTTTADTLTKSVYIPKKMVQKTADYPSAFFDFGSNFIVKWKTDTYTPGDTVIIMVSYLPTESRYRVSSLPSDISPLIYMVPDNGSYTISQSALSVFPKNAYIQIELGRGAQVSGTLPISHTRIQYFGISQAYTLPLLVRIPL